MKVWVESEQWRGTEEESRKNSPRHIRIPIESKAKIEAAYNGRTVILRTSYVKNRTSQRPTGYDVIVELTTDEIKEIVTKAYGRGTEVMDANAVKDVQTLLEEASDKLQKCFLPLPEGQN